MRLFIALELPTALKDQLAGLTTDLPGAVWTRRDAYHLTLRFLGETAAERLPALTGALTAIQQPAPLVTLHGVGRFPPGANRAARVLWVGLLPNPALTALYQQVERVVCAAGFAPADRPFHPHITLARLKTAQPEPSVAAFLRQHADFAAEPFRPDAFSLIHSTLTPQGARYQSIAAFPLLRSE